MLYGIIGYPLTHTFSPNYFNTKFEGLGIDAVYQKFPLAHIDEFKSLLRSHADLSGLNVTIPHKETVIPYLDQLDHSAYKIGAVNTIAFKNGKTTGYNTDVIGFTNSLKPLLQPHHTHALILGTGGAAKAVAYALAQLQIAYCYVSRSPTEGQMNYHQLDENIMAQHTVLINASPVGMAPNVHQCPDIPYHLLGEQHLLYDLIYQPDTTLFLAKGAEQGAATKNGYDMLIAQAEAAWVIWNSH